VIRPSQAATPHRRPPAAGQPRDTFPQLRILSEAAIRQWAGVRLHRRRDRMPSPQPRVTTGKCSL